MKTKYDLEERLITFAIRIIEIIEQLPKTKAGTHIANQLVRCGTSPALNYGEVQAAESTKDFIHKMRIILKELRETRICLIIIIRKPFLKVESDFNECSELVAIFAKSIKTAENNKLIKNNK
ncbi:MAG: four helix bundle protein [Bacteroidales bacterium]|nr:four helix bundle protein [Bacteroidales bacterium]